MASGRWRRRCRPSEWASTGARAAHAGFDPRGLGIDGESRICRMGRSVREGIGIRDRRGDTRGWGQRAGGRERRRRC